jgi:aryl-alcohol dehydrogenase-like predicted oxidoreductase
MRHADFLSLGKPTSQVGLGCGRLVGRSSMRSSARVVDKALQLGIRYFDVAPSYGLGTAEEVIGHVIGASAEVTIATKVGISRPAYAAHTNLARRLAKPVLDRQGSLKRVAQRRQSKPREGEKRQAFDFSNTAVRQSLAESLEHLRRNSIDVLLAHEPRPSDLHEDVEEVFRGLVAERLATAYGVGIGAARDHWSHFGTIWQSRWPGPALADYEGDVAYVFHGVVRSALEHPASRVAPHVSTLLREVLEGAPESIFLVSSSSPKRLAELMRDV